MPKLNQIIAVEKGVKSKSFQELTEAHHAVQKAALLSGLARSYQPKDEEGEQLPPESTKVQVRTEEVLRQISASTSTCSSTRTAMCGPTTPCGCGTSRRSGCTTGCGARAVPRAASV